MFDLLYIKHQEMKAIIVNIMNQEMKAKMRFANFCEVKNEAKIKKHKLSNSERLDKKKKD